MVENQEKISDKELAEMAATVGRRSSSAVLQAASLLLALQLSPWPVADRAILEKWKSSSRLPKTIALAVDIAEALSTLGFYPGADWFLCQAWKRAELVDYLIPALVKRLKSKIKEPISGNFKRSKIYPYCKLCDKSIEMLASSEAASAVVCCCDRMKNLLNHVKELEKGVSESNAAKVSWEVSVILSYLEPFAALVQKYIFERLAGRAWFPQVLFMKKLRNLQDRIDEEISNKDKVEFLQSLDLTVSVEPPSSPMLTHLVYDSQDRLWLISAKQVIIISDSIVSLNERLRIILEDNKVEVKQALEGKENVGEFWDKRKYVDSEISQILNEANEVFFPAWQAPEKIYLAIPNSLLNFPFEALPGLASSEVIRAVPLLKGCKNSSAPGFAVLNPAGDLQDTEKALIEVLKDKKVDQITAGSSISETELLENLKKHEIFVYAGHCGGERYWNGTAIQKLNGGIKSSVFLLGCKSAASQAISSAASQPTSFITPFHYLIGGAPQVVGILWDVLGRDCDRLSRAVMSGDVWGSDRKPGAAIRAVKMKYLTAAAFVIYSSIS